MYFYSSDYPWRKIEFRRTTNRTLTRRQDEGREVIGKARERGLVATAARPQLASEPQEPSVPRPRRSRSFILVRTHPPCTHSRVGGSVGGRACVSRASEPFPF